MKRPSTYLRRANDANTDQAMTPMIDVIFLLLVFFVCTTSFQIIEQMLPSRLSSTVGNQVIANDPPPEEQDFDQVVIRIGWDGSQPTWQINGVVVASFEQIRGHLVAMASVKMNAPLILHPDPQVPIGPVIAAYDESKLTGFEKVSFAINPRGARK